jgi:ubiquinone/menaquinone biosynthesis C-methylase UbiE
MTAENPYFGATDQELDNKRLMIQSGGFNLYTEKFIEKLNLSFDTAIDIGTGTGMSLPIVAKYADWVTALDSDSDKLAEASNLVKLFDLGDRVKLIQASATELDLPDSTFDLAHTRLLLTNLPVEIHQQVVNSSARILKPSGILVIEELGIDKGWRTDPLSSHFEILIAAVMKANIKVGGSNQTGPELENLTTAAELTTITKNSYRIESRADEPFAQIHKMFLTLYVSKIVEKGVLTQEDFNIHLAGFDNDLKTNPEMKIWTPKMFQLAAKKIS